MVSSRLQELNPKIASLFVVDEVNWVQCDGPCEGWLHQLCAGIRNPDDIANLEKWFCPTCSSNVEASVVGAAEALLSMAGLVEPSALSVLDQVATSDLNGSGSNLEGSQICEEKKEEHIEMTDSI